MGKTLHPLSNLVFCTHFLAVERKNTKTREIETTAANAATESCFRNFYAAATTPKGGSAAEKNDQILAAANNYFRWCGRPDLVQTQQRRLDRDDQAPPALTRVEYLKLLRTARTQGRYRIYLLVKLFATTDLPLQCLDQVTVELVRQGRGSLNYRGSPVEFVCPAGLQKELLEYMELNGVYRGPVFVTRSGQPIDRSNLFRCMQELCRAAGVPEEKGNPRCLRNLYKATQQEIRDRLSALQQQMYDQLLDVEQEAVGWPVDRAADRGRPA